MAANQGSRQHQQGKQGAGSRPAKGNDGFERLELDMPSVRWADVESITGKVIDRDVFHGEKGEKRVLIVVVDGAPTRLFEQPGLRRLFDKVNIGDSVRVTATGFRDLEGNEKMRTFEADIKRAPVTTPAARAEAGEQVALRPSRKGKFNDDIPF